MRKTVVSGAQILNFACVRQKRFFKKGLLQNVLHFAAPWFFSCDALCNSFFCSSISESLAIILRLCVPQLIIRTGWIADQLLVRAKLNKLALLEHRDVFAEPAGG